MSYLSPVIPVMTGDILSKIWSENLSSVTPVMTGMTGDRKLTKFSFLILNMSSNMSSNNSSDSFRGLKNMTGDSKSDVLLNFTDDQTCQNCRKLFR